jgi:hypothetical protein
VDTRRLWSCPASGGGTRVGSGAALSREVGTGAVGTCGAPAAALRREVGAALGAAPSRSIVGCF